MDGLISSGLRTHKKLQPSKDGTAAFLVLIYPEKAYFHCPDLPGSHSKSTHIIFHIQKTVPPSASNRLFMWRQSRNFWFAEICVIHKNPLSERSELWIFVNDLSSFRQALEFRSAATESPEGACARGVHENQTILFSASGLNLLSYSSTLLIGTLTNLLYSFFPCKVLIYPQI